MERDEQSLIEPLLDWHLDRLDEQERLRIENELRCDPRLRAKSERLGQTLQPLDHWCLNPAPPNLVGKVLSHIARRTHSSREALQLPVEASGHRRLPLLSVRDLIAVAACIALLIWVFVPGLSVLRSGSRRAICAGNLSSIFRGTSTYQAAFAGFLPFAGRIPGASWLPFAGSIRSEGQDRPYASNSRHVYLLVKFNFGPKPKDFICPGNPAGEPMQAAKLAACNDFARARNISYASLNMAGPIPNVRPTMPIAYVSDANPLFVDARFNEAVDPDKTNSHAHGGKGQTVLTLDGSARWMTTPIYGPKRDNLWLAGNIRRYTGIEAPTSEDDVQLLPGYPATDPALYGSTSH